MAPQQVFDIVSQDDFYAFRQVYYSLVASEEACALEARFAPGKYLVDLIPPGSPHTDKGDAIDITLRGGPGVVLVSPDLRARHLRLESLEIHTEGSGSMLWQVSRALEMEGVVVVDSLAASMDGYGHILAVHARGPAKGLSRGVKATLIDCWFLRNYADGRAMSLLSFDVASHTRAHWASIQIREGGFLGNLLATDLSLHFAGDVRIVDSLWLQGRAEGVLVQSTSSDKVVLDRSLLVVADRAQVARHGAESPDIVLGKGTRVLSEAPLPATAPTGYVAEAAQHVQIAPDDAAAARLRALVGTAKDVVDREALGTARRELLALP